MNAHLHGHTRRPSVYAHIPSAHPDSFFGKHGYSAVLGGTMYGAQTTPLIFFWDKKERPIARELEHEQTNRIVYDGTLRGARFVVTLGGYVASERQDRREAAEDVNAFLLAVTLLRAHTLDPIGDNDLDICEVVPGTSQVEFRGGRLGRLGSGYSLYPEFLLMVCREMPSLPVADAAVLPDAVHLAEELAKSGYRVAFTQVLRAISAKSDGESITAFMSGWIVLEMLLSAELRRFMSHQGSSDDVISESLKAWTVHTKLRLLRRWNVLKALVPGDLTVPTESQLKDIGELARPRNRVVHAGVPPDPQEVGRVVELAWKAMWRFLKLSGISYQPYVDAVNTLQQAFVARHNLP